MRIPAATHNKILAGEPTIPLKFKAIKANPTNVLKILSVLLIFVFIICNLYSQNYLPGDSWIMT